MTVHLKHNNKVINYNTVEGWEILSLRGLFGGHTDYALHVQFVGKKKGPDSWDRIAINESKEKLETMLTDILKAVNEAEGKGGGIVSIDQRALTASVL